jgi:hypothetical protein
MSVRGRPGPAGDDAIQNELRKMLAARADSPPPINDVTAVVIRRARAARRRRTAGTSAAAAVILVLALAGVLSARAWWSPEGRVPIGGTAIGPGLELPRDTPAPKTPTPSPTPNSGPAGGAPAVDLRVGGELWSADGRRLALDGVGTVTRIYRIPLGWVYGGAHRVRLLAIDGTRRDLAAAEAWVMSPDGSVLAFRRGGTLGVADLTARGLALRDATTVPAGVTPVAFVKDRVVLASADGASHDSWQPGGPYHATWNRQVAAVYGRFGENAIGLVRDANAKVCIAALAPGATGLRVGRTGGCALGSQIAGAKRAAKSAEPARAGVLGPDGRWLAVPTVTGYLLVDVGSVLSGPEVAVDCPARGPIAWLDATTAVGRDDGGAIACHVDGSRNVVNLPEGLGPEWDFVPTLAAAGGD